MGLNFKAKQKKSVTLSQCLHCKVSNIVETFTPGEGSSLPGEVTRVSLANTFTTLHIHLIPNRL